MKLIEQTTEFHIPEVTAIAIGKFDGMHRGHRKLFSCLMKEAKERGLKTAVFTFYPSPAVFFSGKQEGELTTREEKLRIFERMGIDYLVECPFCKETADMDPEVYVEEFLLSKMNGRLIVAGEDVTFGKKAKGDRSLLESLSKECGFDVKIIEKITFDGRQISSTYVRQEVIRGNMEGAANLLGEPYFVSGKVEHGKKLGRKLHMPTANLYPGEDKLLPPKGVYFSNVILKGSAYPAITNIGSRPSVKDGERINAETYLLDFNKEIYGEQIKVELLHFRRAEARFPNEEALKAAVHENIREAREYFKLS
ncbi:MAG: bifunctional riboflavin kinase/FAD synthetase [Lachnospiraceae bacterium]|nr:bifunctional riboflavin kinase/FAD synthetase [Lachnospiraceae bacterium]